MAKRVLERGKIESMFIETKYRKYGYGAQLVKNSIQWLKSKKCKKIIVAVADGHESMSRKFIL